MFLSATRPPRHNFVVSVITSVGFKLRSSNLTYNLYALLIQISRTSLIIDIVGGHFVKILQKKDCVWI